MSYNLILPKRTGTNERETLEVTNNVVLIGSNGSGKTRLGNWIEQQHQGQTVHRISAQKALNIPDFAKLKNLEQAEKDLLIGNADPNVRANQKSIYRWGKNPVTFLLNDYEKLLSLLFAKTAERDRLHTKETKEKQTYIPVPDAPIDIIVRIWSDIMPHREISFNDGKVMVRKQGEPEYHGKEMSDGERVALYLIGQCLCIPENSIIVIDEPEIHLHKALVDKLWNKVEELSQNKLLVYITHDLDFASSRTDAHKFWVKSYNGNNLWEWDDVPQDENLPEGLVLEILGNRKNIIFCEGENGSLDTSVYQLFYPTFHIIPRGGGDKVIESTKALRSNESIHHLNAFGIVDRDYKEEEYIQVLRSHGIFTVSVAEIENLFCVEPVLSIIAEHLELNPDEKVEEVKDFLVDALTQEFDLQVANKAEKVVEYKLGAYSKEANSEQGLRGGLNTTLDSIDINEIFTEARDRFQEAINERNIDKLLLLYNRKSLPNRLSPIFGLGSGQYGKLLVRLLKGAQKESLINALRAYLPEIE